MGHPLFFDEECFEHLSQRQVIFRALLAEVAGRSVDDIKVADLCKRCNISRTTFYRYFSGVKDIPTWYQQVTAELGMHQIGHTRTCADGHRLSIELIAKAQPLYRNFVRWWNPNYSLRAINGQVESMKLALERRGIQVDSIMRYKLEGISYCSHETVGSWVNNDMDIPAEDLVNVLVSFYPDDLRRIFDDPPLSPDTTLVEILFDMANSSEV